MGLLLLYRNPAPIGVSVLHRFQLLRLPWDDVQRVIANHFGCQMRGDFMSALTKTLLVMALGLMTIAEACNRSAPKQAKTISASSDSKGVHSANTTTSGPVRITCVSATDDSGNATPPACIIDAPGTSGVVDIGHKVAVAGAGNVILTCRGSGTLNCTAQIEE
jgi:hypothetical protein